MQQLNGKEQSAIDLTQECHKYDIQPSQRNCAHAYQMLTHPFHLVLPSAQWKIL